MTLILDVGVVLRDRRMSPNKCDRILLLEKVVDRAMWIATYEEGGPVFALPVALLEKYFEATDG